MQRIDKHDITAGLDAHYSETLVYCAECDICGEEVPETEDECICGNPVYWVHSKRWSDKYLKGGDNLVLYLFGKTPKIRRFTSGSHYHRWKAIRSRLTKEQITDTIDHCASSLKYGASGRARLNYTLNTLENKVEKREVESEPRLLWSLGEDTD